MAGFGGGNGDWGEVGRGGDGAGGTGGGVCWRGKLDGRQGWMEDCFVGGRLAIGWVTNVGGTLRQGGTT